jgi:DNA-binding HxlR family transcriptional regulator
VRQASKATKPIAATTEPKISNVSCSERYVTVRDVFLGLRRFDQLQESLGIARNVLADRLGNLVEAGILERVRYSERPERYEYRLTDKGLELNLALTGLRQWGDKYLSKRPPRVLRRKSDGKPVIAALVVEGARVLRPDEVESVAGPLH